ncbi:GL16621, partial [Drosophila persimilis]
SEPFLALITAQTSPLTALPATRYPLPASEHMAVRSDHPLSIMDSPINKAHTCTHVCAFSPSLSLFKQSTSKNK